MTWIYNHFVSFCLPLSQWCSGFVTARYSNLGRYNVRSKPLLHHFDHKPVTVLLLMLAFRINIAKVEDRPSHNLKALSFISWQWMFVQTSLPVIIWKGPLITYPPPPLSNFNFYNSCYKQFTQLVLLQSKVITNLEYVTCQGQIFPEEVSDKRLFYQYHSLLWLKCSFQLMLQECFLLVWVKAFHNLSQIFPWVAPFWDNSLQTHFLLLLWHPVWKDKQPIYNLYI